MSLNKRLTIIGATGNLGIPVAKCLLLLGYELTLLVRNKEKAQRIFGHNSTIQIEEADLNDTNALQKALINTEYLYLNLSTNTLNSNETFLPEREGIANILASVNKACIKQIIAISGLGAFDNVNKPNGFKFIPNIIRKQGHKFIKESGIPYTFLHCSWFADCFVIYQRKAVYSVIGDTTQPIFFTNCYNYSVHLDQAIGNENAFYKEFPIQGNEGYKHPDAAKSFLSIYSPKSKVSELPYGVIRFLSLFNKQMKLVKMMCEYSYASKEEFLAEECGTYNVLGKPELSLNKYATIVKQEGLYSHLEMK